MSISLDKIKMNVIETANNGVVNENTIFIFTQIGNNVTAEYSGGKIKQGYLVGKIEGNKLNFSYCQMQDDGNLDNGTSECELKRNDNGKIQLIENFEWASRPGEIGVNIFEEI